MQIVHTHQIIFSVLFFNRGFETS